MTKWLSHARNAIIAAPLAYPPGHYYSPICDPHEFGTSYTDPDTSPAGDIPGIDLRESDQVKRWHRWQEFLPATHWQRYSPVNRYYALGDAIPLYCLLRELRPQRLIEIGCGFSSASMIDTIEAFSLPTECTFIDPDLSRVHRDDADAHTFIKMPIQQASIELFDALHANDILFIDSTHVLKTKSDVCFELFSILPRLKPGVFIHFHDIFHPFEYPKEWVIGRNYSWNEAYALRAFLSYNSAFRIEFWNHYVAKLLPEAASLRGGAGLWISRL